MINRFSVFHQLVFVFFVFFSLVINVGYLSANEDKILAADSIQVKQQSQNSLIAKEKALAIALKKSFMELLKDRVGVSNKDNASVSSIIPEKEINDCVYDYSIENEKHSASTYICEVSYRFDERKILQLLDKYGIAHELKIQDETKSSFFRVSVYTTDYIKVLSNIDYCVIEKFSPQIVILRIKNCTPEEFRKFGIRYAQL